MHQRKLAALRFPSLRHTEFEPLVRPTTLQMTKSKRKVAILSTHHASEVGEDVETFVSWLFCGHPLQKLSKIPEKSWMMAG